MRDFPFTQQREPREQLYSTAVELYSYLGLFLLMILYHHELRERLAVALVALAARKFTLIGSIPAVLIQTVLPDRWVSLSLYGRASMVLQMFEFALHLVFPQTQLFPLHPSSPTYLQLSYTYLFIGGSGTLDLYFASVFAHSCPYRCRLYSNISFCYSL